MARMLVRIPLALLALALLSCSEIPPPAEVGAGGTLGTGDGGADGIGGGGGADPCAVVVPETTSDLETGDRVEGGIAIGTVSTGADPIDRWSITTCGGSHSVLLTWNAMTLDLDLDLLLLDSDDQVVDSATTRGEPHAEEMITDVNLAAGQEFFIEVRAIDTEGVESLSYNLTVFRGD